MDEVAGTSAAASGTFRLGGELPVVRLGFGTMRLPGPGVWGEPADRAGAVRLLRRAVEFGVRMVDTADSYGPYVAEDLVAEALYPYPTDLVIATKGGLTRQGPDAWAPVGRPAYLRQCVEMSLRRLRVDRIDLYYLHRIDPEVPVEDQVGELAALRAEGKIGHLGLSGVEVDEIEKARAVAPIAAVQNVFSLTRQLHRDTVDYCTAHNIGFVPFFPLGRGELAASDGVLAEFAAERGVSPAQLALAWLLHLSPAMLPIPGTSDVRHLAENVAAAGVALTAEDVAALTPRWSDAA